MKQTTHCGVVWPGKAVIEAGEPGVGFITRTTLDWKLRSLLEVRDNHCRNKIIFFTKSRTIGYQINVRLRLI